MKLRGSFSLPVALVAILALALGTATSATAGGITKHTVKAVAAKVVKKAAPTLSVAHAATADTATTASNSTLLNGQPPTAYQNPAYTFAFPAQAASGNFTKTIPAIPAGTYAMSVDVIGQTTDATKPVFCQVDQGGAALGSANGSTFGSLATVTFSRVVSLTSAALTVNCQDSSPATLTLPSPLGFGTSSVSFVKVDSLTSGTLTKSGAAAGESTNGAPAGRN